MKKILIILVAFALPAILLSMKPAPKLNVYLFLQADCPCVYSHKDSFGKLLKQYSDEVNFRIIFEGKDDDKLKIEKLLTQLDWKVSYTKDTDRKLLKQFKPSLSTDCVVFDQQSNVIYRGTIDDGVKNMGMIKYFYLHDVINAFLQKKPIPWSNVPGTGCRIV